MKKNTRFLVFFALLSFSNYAFAKAYTATATTSLKTVDGLQNHHFIFGTSEKADDGTIISSAHVYNPTSGYGFDFDTASNVTLTTDGLIATEGFYFSVQLEEGNYQVKVTLGNLDKESLTTIKAESKRLMVRENYVPKGRLTEVTFNVHVATTRIDDSLQVQLKQREKNALNWDDKLTLEFLGNVALKDINIQKIAHIRTLFIAGDSTVTDQDLEPWAAWGQMMTYYINTDAVIANYAASGASLASFKSRNRFKKILSLIKSGDYVFIEFGHNDEKIKGEGNGAWGLYSQLLKEYVAEIRKKDGIPILLTPTQRRSFHENGLLKTTHGDFPEAMRKVSEELDVPLIDLTKMTTVLYETMGIENSKNLFVHYPAETFKGQQTALKDNTHFNSFGANEIAQCVVQGIKDLDIELINYLKNNIEFYNPKQPNDANSWHVPVSARVHQEKPDGN